MTKAEIKKLETIIGKLEALQNQTTDVQVRDRLGVAKSELIRALRAA